MYQGDLVTCNDPLVQIRWLTANSLGFLYGREQFQSQGDCRRDAPVLLMSWFPVPNCLYKQSPGPAQSAWDFHCCILVSLHAFECRGLSNPEGVTGSESSLPPDGPALEHSSAGRVGKMGELSPGTARPPGSLPYPPQMGTGSAAPT